MLALYRDSNLRMLRYLRNTVNRMIGNGKDAYIKIALEENKDEHKIFWCELNILLNPNKGKKNESTIVDNNGLICHSDIPYLRKNMMQNIVPVPTQVI